jgi:hypothetical protein
VQYISREGAGLLVRPFVFLFVVAALLGAACSRAGSPFTVSLVSITDSRSVVRVTGLSGEELAAIEAKPMSDIDWSRVLSVRVSGARPDTPSVQGRYRVNGDAVEFTPLFSFDAGRKYTVVFDSSRLPKPRVVPLLVTTVSLPAIERKPSTTVVRMLPTAGVLPENLLRVYLEFSEPMSRGSGRDYITLLDETGQEVKDAFLALDVELWSADYRRYTVLFDPGRVKRGILPNELFGRALTPGKKFTIQVDQKWRDGHGQPLAAPFSKTFQVGPADLAPMQLADWKLEMPKAGTTNPLVVNFPKPIDHGLLERSLGIDRRGGGPVNGQISIGAQERSWSFQPLDRWRAGQYVLVVMSNLEDPAGNRIGKPFDIDKFDRIDRSPEPDRFAVPFEVR